MRSVWFMVGNFILFALFINGGIGISDVAVCESILIGTMIISEKENR